MSSKISWTDSTLNPVVGCSKVGEGCRNCYAENMARRLAAMFYDDPELPVRRHMHPQYGKVVTDKRWNGKTAFVPSELEKPYRWKKPRTIFVSSMGDLFHESVNDDWIDSVMQAVHKNPRHTFIFLTKRPERMQRYFKNYLQIYGGHCIAPFNLAIGVSVEDQATANERIPVLLKTPAAKRFISLEPMLGPVDLMNLSGPGNCRYQVLTPILRDDDGARQALDCVIIGGESGPKARPLDPAWVRLVRDQCAAASVPFMFKQWGGKKSEFDEFGKAYYDMDTGFPVLDGRTHTELVWSVKK